MPHFRFLLFASSIAILFVGCSKPDTLFVSLPASETGIDFTNNVQNNDTMNIFNYRNFYNGAGVAIGDVNNDGLADVYVSANQGKNRLYLNKGNMHFEDVTTKAGVGGTKIWSTGVTMADVNGDGWLDIYVCNSGEGDDRANELFINNQNGTFTDKAAEYGLDDKGYSTHAAFFDYDRDGDLDMFLLENSSFPTNKINNQNLRHLRDPLAGQKLFRNNSIDKNSSPIVESSKKPVFEDVSEETGIFGSLIGFGLGITIGDVNNDNWPDIYISNDFFERDYLYINQKNGKFAELSKDQLGHESLSSMGADVADLNNDGHLDIFVTDMLPSNDKRLKTTTTFEDHNVQNMKLQNDFYYQYNHNALHLNNGDQTFSEVACLAGVHATDWSWGALIFDMDNDGKKDIFVANGIYKNVTDQDFVQFLNDEETMRPYKTGEKKFHYKDFVDLMEAVPISNYAFRNGGKLDFANKAHDWGLDRPSFTNGAAYGDLDNDGDLDLIMSNTNEPLEVFKNQSVEKNKTNFLRVKLRGLLQNTNGIGARVRVYVGDTMQVLEQMPNRGFESSSDHVMVFGLGNAAKIDSVVVSWNNDKKEQIKNPKINTLLILDQRNAALDFVPTAARITQPFTDITNQSGLTYQHKELDFYDYDRDILLKQMYSRQGPALAVGDVNADGLDDVYVGGAARGKKTLYVQQPNGSFTEKPQLDFMKDEIAEAVSAVFFDADNDKDQDLFVVTGSNEFFPNFESLRDELYLNDGKGNFARDSRFPDIRESGSGVTAADFDKDGDIDLFVGGRLIPTQYGDSPKSQLYVNQGNGVFQNKIESLMPDADLGMATDAVWADIDKDSWPDLVVTSDWGDIQFWSNQKGKKLSRSPKSESLKNISGWWNRIHATDLDNDGDIDFVVGNQGRNTRLNASETQPVSLYTYDFDQNERTESIMTHFDETGKEYPFLLKQDLQKSIPAIKKKYLKNADYANKTLAEILGDDVVGKAKVRSVNQPNSVVLINNGKGDFEMRILPLEAQFSPIYGIESLDANHDGKLDLLLVGNNFDVLPEMGRYDANNGLVLLGNGKGDFVLSKPGQSGFFVKGQVRNIKKIKTKTQTMVLLGKNNDKMQIFGLK
jgi:enediyne biosynthesis protein E4